MIDPDVAMTYLEFVAERHRVWEARQRGETAPWTADPILAGHKFTNVFRVLDWGSQYVLTDLIDPDLSPRNQLMRLFLYRHTGRVEAWQWLDTVCGLPENVIDLTVTREGWIEYRGKTRITQRGQEARNSPGEKRTSERPLFTGAYLVFPQSAVKGTDKLDSIIDLTRRLFTPSSPDDIMPDFLAATTQPERFATLRRNKGVADFMSMQILTDWGYTPHCGEDRENEFVIAGPGARKGALALDQVSKPERTLEWCVNAIRSLPDCPTIDPHDNWLRLPSLMDIQNTLCEFSKYVRFAAKPSPQKQYQPAHPGLTSYVLPKHWA